MASPQPDGAGRRLCTERVLICLEEQVRYPLPAPSNPSTWDSSYENYIRHHGNLEAGNIAPADDVEASCLHEHWQKKSFAARKENKPLRQATASERS